MQEVKWDGRRTRRASTCCVEYYNRPPMLAEFDWWRRRELELAVAQGNPDLHIPSPTPQALGKLGGGTAPLRVLAGAEQIAERLEQP